MRRSATVIVLALAAIFAAGCDALGVETPEKAAAAREADGKAIGAACRHAGRAIEDCFAIYKKADRAAIFAGWRDMNDYMRENKIEAVAPVLVAQSQAAKPAGEAKPEPARPLEPETAKPKPRDGKGTGS